MKALFCIFIALFIFRRLVQIANGLSRHGLSLKAFLRFREIRGADGTLYLTRYAITGWLPGDPPWRIPSIYLHEFHRPDEDRHLHTHPWTWSASLILRGGYNEDRLDLDAWFSGGSVAPGTLLSRIIEFPQYGYANGFRDHAVLRPGCLNIFPRGRAHRITRLLAPSCWTLFLAGPKRTGDDAWGFVVDGRGIVPWREYLAARGEKVEY